MASPPRLAWIGLGNMGRGMVKNIVEKGSFSGPLLIYNRTASRSDTLVASLPPDQARVVDSIAEAVRGADIIFACLSNDAAVQETLATALQSSPEEVTGKLFVDCSTVHPDTTNALAQTCSAAGALFLACPVFGAPAMADAGQLVAVLAGPAPLISRIQPFTKGVIARAEIVYADQPCGAATHLKIIGNTFILAMLNALSEGHVLAEKSGLGVDNLHAFIEVMFPGPYTAYSNRLRSGDYYDREEPLFSAELARKDANHARSLATAAGVQMKGLELADQRLEEVVRVRGAKGDIAGIYGAVRKESGLKFENQ